MDTRQVMSNFPSKWPLDRKRKAQDKLDSGFDWIECPPAKQMVIDSNLAPEIVNDGYVVNSDDGGMVTVDKQEETAKDNDNTYYEFEENCADFEDSSSVDHYNNNDDYCYEGEEAINKKRKRDDDHIRSMVLSEEVRETISNRSKDGSARILPQSIMDRMYHQNTNTALVLWKPPSERSAGFMFKTLETIPPMSTVDEDDETNIIIDTLEKKVTLRDPGEMEL